jgi:hypothetical protein
MQKENEELKLAKENDRGVRAEILLKDELIQEAFTTLKENYKDEIIKTEIGDNEHRLNLLVHYKTLEKIEDHLKEIVITGKLANEQLKSLKKF